MSDQDVEAGCLYHTTYGRLLPSLRKKGVVDASHGG